MMKIKQKLKISNKIIYENFVKEPEICTHQKLCAAPVAPTEMHILHFEMQVPLLKLSMPQSKWKIPWVK
jgi:hypothetical protein